MKKILLSMSLILVITAIGVAQQKPPAKGAATPPPAAATPQQKQVPAQVSDSFVIGLEDVLQVTVWKEPDHSAPQVVVRPDGMITLPLVGEIKAAGSTPKQLEAIIAERLKDYLTAPAVTITVLKIESQKVSIVGQIGKPGAYPLGAPMTVLDLIARAGGLTELAKSKNIKVLRKKDGQTLPFNYREVISGKNLKQNVFLQNGDTVLIPG